MHTRSSLESSCRGVYYLLFSNFGIGPISTSLPAGCEHALRVLLIKVSSYVFIFVLMFGLGFCYRHLDTSLHVFERHDNSVLCVSQEHYVPVRL